MNEFGVAGSISGERVMILVAPPRELSKDRALEFAAWIVAIADPLDEKFQSILETVRNT